MAAHSQTQSFMESRISTTPFKGLLRKQNNENWYNVWWAGTANTEKSPGRI